MPYGLSRPPHSNGALSSPMGDATMRDLVVWFWLPPCGRLVDRVQLKPRPTGNAMWAGRNGVTQISWAAIGVEVSCIAWRKMYSSRSHPTFNNIVV
nr:hypothetical protein CFP56_00878 [Quercus suber]